MLRPVSDHRRREASNSRSFLPILILSLVLFTFLYLDTLHEMSFAMVHGRNANATEAHMEDATRGTAVFPDRRKTQASSSSSTHPTSKSGGIPFWKRMLMYLMIPSFLAAFRNDNVPRVGGDLEHPRIGNGGV